jgi:hypothetical protein
MENEIFKNSRNFKPITGGDKPLNKYFFIRLFLSMFIIVLGILNSLFGFILPDGDVTCYFDKSFILTESINTWLSQNTTAFHALLISSSLCMDAVVVAILINWVLNGKSWRLIIVILSFYSLRAMLQVYTQ